MLVPLSSTLSDLQKAWSKLTWLQCGFLIGGSVLVGWRMKSSWTTRRKNRKITALINKRRAEREYGIRKIEAELASSKLDMEKAKFISGMSAKQLRDKLQNEELKPVQVLQAFQSNALVAHEKTNCVTQFITEAQDQCLLLEQQYKGREKPPLYGLPFSVKEWIGASKNFENWKIAYQLEHVPHRLTLRRALTPHAIVWKGPIKTEPSPFQVKGYDSTAGLSRYLFDPVPADGPIVARLRQLGAVPFVLTNNPQTLFLLAFNCYNPIYGGTTNPVDPKRTCGGSSGGEAALAAFRGSAFGIGSDVAGSNRTPAHFCGIATLKPCTHRLSVQGGRRATPGCSLVPAAYGPMASDVDSLVLFMEHLLDDEFFAMDANIAPIRFRRNLYADDRKLVIGYYDYDGLMEAVPACRRAVGIAKRILEEKGHELVKFTPPNVDKLFEHSGKILIIDSGKYVYQEWCKDIMSPYLMKTARWFSLPIWVRRLIAEAYRSLGHKKLATFLGSFTTSTRDLAATLAEVARCKNEFNSEWRRLKLDAVICPPGASVAMPNGYAHITPVLMYNNLYNILDYAAGVVPVTTVTEEDQKKTATKYKADEHFAKLVKACNQEGAIGLPVGVQCAASTYNEEIVLRVMKEIEDGVKRANEKLEN